MHIWVQRLSKCAILLLIDPTRAIAPIPQEQANTARQAYRKILPAAQPIPD